MPTDLKHKKYVMEILADAFSIGASMADLEPHLRDQCYYHSDLINKGFYSAERILQHMDWVCEKQKEFCRCEIVLLQDILREEIKLAAFDRYEGVAPCEYALLFYEGDNSSPAAVIITMMDDNYKLASIVLCRSKELFQIDLGEDRSDANRRYSTDPFYICGQQELNGKTVYLDQYPVGEITTCCAKYMYSLDWNAIEIDVQENLISYFDISDSIDMFSHLQLDEEYDLYCYITREYHGLWGRVAAVKKGTQIEPTNVNKGCFSLWGSSFELPESSAPPMEAIYNDGAPEGYFEAIIAEEFFRGLPYACFERKNWDNCITEHPKDYGQNWCVNVEIPDWRPRLCFNDRDGFYMYSFWRKFENGCGSSDGKDEIYLRKHWFLSKCRKKRESGIYKSHIENNDRFSFSKRCCENNLKEILIAKQKHHTNRPRR